MKKLGCFLVFVLVLTSAQAFASGDVTIYGGWQRQGKLTLQTATSSVGASVPNVFTFDPKNFGTFGARFGIGNKVIGTESTFGYSPNFISSNAHAIILNQNLNLQIPTPVVKPYATVGLGTIVTKVKNDCTTPLCLVSDIGARFAVNYGGGVKVMAGPIGARLDVRGYAIPAIQSQTLNLLEVSLGVVFGF
jgi:hypothetical protein